METLPELFAARRPAPTTPLLTLESGEVLTYGDVDRRSAQVAAVLAAHRVGRGDRVVVQVEKSPLAVCLYLACLRAGIVFVPLNPAYTDDERSYFLADAGPALVVHDPQRSAPEGLPALSAGADGSGTLADAADAAAPTFDDAPVGPDDLAAMLYTSGTTGRPKGATLTQRNLASNAAALHATWGFAPDDVLLHALPVFHAHGLFVALNTTLANGTGMVFLPRFEVDAVLDHLADATVFMGVPTYYTRLLADARLDRERCAGIRLFVSGSAPLSAATHRDFAARTGHAILERYGMTETGMIASNPLGGERRPGSVGFPLPGVEVRITGPTPDAPGASVEVDAGTVGDVEVRGPNVFPGYWQRPDLAATEFSADGFFRTGDLGRFDPDGYLHLVGRSKDLVISGGLNVYPSEIEAVLDALEAVAESAVIGVPDPDFGEVVVAVVVASDGAAPDPEAIRTAARERLAAFKVPKRVHVVGELPRNAMGKVEKAVLRARLSGPVVRDEG